MLRSARSISPDLDSHAIDKRTGDTPPHMTTRTRSRRAPDRGSPLEGIVSAALEDMKAVNVKIMDVRGLTDIADVMVVASGNSDRHVKSIADRIIEKAKESGFRPLGVEGAREGEWVLVDLQDVVVHVMLPRVREFYSLERMWESDTSAVANAAPVGGIPAQKPAPRKRVPRRKPS